MSPSFSQPISFSPKTFSPSAAALTCGALAAVSAPVATDALANGASAPDEARVFELNILLRARSEWSCGTRKRSSGFCGMTAPLEA